MVTSLVSLLTNRPIRPFTAMTGEITLSGPLLPIGGIKEKILAARRSGIKRVRSAPNQRDSTFGPSPLPSPPRTGERENADPAPPYSRYRAVHFLSGASGPVNNRRP